MAATTPKKTAGVGPRAAATGPLKEAWLTVRLTDMSGGRNTLVPADLLNDNESPNCQYIDLQLKGIVRPAQGRVARYASAFAAGGVSGIGAYYKSDGTTRLLAGVGAQLYYDTPHLITKWATQADFQQTGTVAEGTLLEPTGGGLQTQAAASWSWVKSTYATWTAVLNESL